MKLSENFTLEELTQSATARAYGIDNEPTASAAANLRRLAVEILQPIRDAYAKPISINSGYRCPELNKRVKGSNTSQHLTGQAADISCTKTSKAVLFNLILGMIRSGKIRVGQLVWEYGSKKEPKWIHISLPRNGKPNNQVLYYYDT